jgi:ABC-type uncharacterized transport system ATPase subunit
LYVLRFCTCVYPYAMKYLIIFSFGQNVSRMNTGDLTKLWRLIILSSHNLNLVQKLSDSILFINAGKCEFYGTSQEFKDNYKIDQIDQSWLEILNIKTQKMNKLITF